MMAAGMFLVGNGALVLLFRGAMWSDEAVVESVGDCFAVHVLADEYDFLHAVAIGLVPVAHESGFAGLQLFEFFFRCCCIPLAAGGQFFLDACLFKKI